MNQVEITVSEDGHMLKMEGEGYLRWVILFILFILFTTHVFSGTITLE